MTKRRRISLFLALLLSAAAVTSGVMVYRELSDRQKEKEDFAALADLVNCPPETQTETKPSSIDAPAGGTAAKSESAPPATMEEPKSPGRNLAPLYAQNSDFLGWLCIPGTEIDYPVMHTPYEPQKYLRRNFEGKYSVSGVPFLDYRCTVESDNLIIYGHNMSSGTMFAGLKRYTDKDYLAEHPIIEWETAEGCVRYEVFAVVTVKKTDDWYGFIDAQDESDFLNWTEYIRSKAMLTTDSVPVYGRQILTLSTCHGSGKDGRLLVVAVEI
jgi:sortase B